jgi:hypothetical protein
MDTDVVVIANLNALIVNMDDTKLFQGSPTFFCSGFTVVNMRKFHQFWEKVDQLDMDPMPVGDQEIMSQVKNHFPETFGPLRKEWDRNLGNGWRRRPHGLLKQNEAAGMLHFQAGSGRKKDDNYFSNGFQLYCSRTPVCRDNKVHRDLVARSCGLGDFYTRLTWN